MSEKTHRNKKINCKNGGKVKKENKIPNLIIIGPSSSGKTTICEILAKTYKGIRISLDGRTDAGRGIYEIAKLPRTGKIDPAHFTNKNAGDLIRLKMIQEALKAEEKNIPYFMDDAFDDIIDLARKYKLNAKIIILMPTFETIRDHIIKRNIKANNPCEERTVFNTLSQLNKLCSVHSVKLHTNAPFLDIKIGDIIDLMKIDKIFYSENEYSEWEKRVIDCLHMYKFSVFNGKGQKKYIYSRPYIGSIPIICHKNQKPEQLIGEIIAKIKTSNKTIPAANN